MVSKIKKLKDNDSLNKGLIIQFKEEALLDVETKFNNVKVDFQKRQIINGVAEIISKYVSVKELVLRGVVLLSAKATQQELQLELKNMDSMAPLDKKIFIQTVFKKIEQKLEKMMVSSKDADKTKLHAALEEAYKFRMSQNI